MSTSYSRTDDGGFKVPGNSGGASKTGSSAGGGGDDPKLVHKIPQVLQTVVKTVARGFYAIEDVLIIDMLTQNACMKEDDICELLKFEKKMFRSRIASLKNDKFIQTKLRMETGLDGKAQRANYYYINYKSVVNVIKYKLDMMRKRMETEERDATSRASFKCTSCLKTFTDLEADQLYDYTTSEFTCTFCGESIEEDQSAIPKKDSRLLLAKFNEQMESLFNLLKMVEDYKLAPEILEPEPTDMTSLIKGTTDNDRRDMNHGQWSGESTRRNQFGPDGAQMTVTINNSDDENDTDRAAAAAAAAAANNTKLAPIWMTESTIGNLNDDSDSLRVGTSGQAMATADTSTTKTSSDDIMNLLLAHEKRSTDRTQEERVRKSSTLAALKSIQQQQQQQPNGPDSDDDSDSGPDQKLQQQQQQQQSLGMPSLLVDDGGDSLMAEDGADVGAGAGAAKNDDDDDDDDDEPIPTVMVGGQQLSLLDIDDTVIAQMTPDEKFAYVQVYQEFYAHIYD